MERATAYGYRVEVVDEMRRAILPGKDWRTYRGLVKRLKELRPEIVHTHSSKAGIIGRWAAHRAGVPGVVHTIHGLAFTASTNPGVNWVYKKLEGVTAPITDRIACVAGAMAEQSLAAGIGRPGQYVTVYSGMGTGPYLEAASKREEVRAALGLKAGDVAVGTIARLFYLKGHEDVFAMAPRLCAKFPNLRWVWVGDGLLREEFERKMVELGLRDRFILTGLVKPERIPELANAMDVLLHPSRREGLARAIVQGQLGGCPAVAYDIDGNREGLLEGETGFAVKAFDVGVLEEKVEMLVGDEGKRKEMGARGREFAVGRFDGKAMVEALERVYAEALKAHGSRA
jgi:glycosyltransferase involved in cell wall biosynthesis